MCRIQTSWRLVQLSCMELGRITALLLFVAAAVLSNDIDSHLDFDIPTEGQVRKAYRRTINGLEKVGISIADEATQNLPKIYFVQRLEYDELPNTSIFGRHDATADRIVLIAPDCLATEFTSWWGLVPSEELYLSFIIHEFTHSILNRLRPGLSTLWHEFVAYTIQISALSDSMIAALYSANYYPPWNSIMCFDGVGLQLFGYRFGLAAYKLTERQPNLLKAVVDQNEETLSWIFSDYGQWLLEEAMRQ